MKNILKNYQTFLDKLFEKLIELKLDFSNLKLDHIGYQASSTEDYNNLKSEFLKLGKLVDENIVGNRRVTILKLKTPLPYKKYLIKVIELVEPKKDQTCPSGFEHIELILKEDFKSFMQKYPNLKWDTRAIDRDIFPMLILKLGNNMQIKFPKNPVLEAVKKQISKK